LNKIIFNNDFKIEVNNLILLKFYLMNQIHYRIKFLNEFENKEQYIINKKKNVFIIITDIIHD